MPTKAPEQGVEPRNVLRTAAPRTKTYEPRPEYVDFGIALRKHRQMAGFPTQASLAAMVGVSTHAVCSWENGVWAPDPAKVFEVENAMALSGGTLSQFLGYVPTGTQPSVISVIESDNHLDEAGRRLMVEMYRSLAKPASRRRPVPAKR